MKKLFTLLFIFVLIPFFAACDSKEYENFQELNDGSRLQKGDITYSFYGPLPKDSLIGNQIGIIDGDKQHKVFAVNGYSSDEWIIEYYDVIMSTYSVYKSYKVIEIPEIFK